MAAVGSDRHYTSGLFPTLNNYLIGFLIPIEVDITFGFQNLIPPNSQSPTKTEP